MAAGGSGGKQPLIVICGPTASGKSALALALAETLPMEIISADSRQVYRYMDIGTAKPTGADRSSAPHHLIDVVDPDEDFTAADFCRLGREAVGAIASRAALPVVVGGTGLYIRALTDGLLPAPGRDRDLRRRLLEREKSEGEGSLHRHLQEADPPLAQRLPPGDLVRIVRALEVFHLAGRRLSELQAEHAREKKPFRTLKIAIGPEREELYRKIDARVEEMLRRGLVGEVRSLLEKGYSPTLKALRTIGYQEVIQHLDGRLSLEEAVALIQRNTRRYAKRQFTWFKKDKSIIWVDSSREFVKIQSLIGHFMDD